MNNQDWYLNQLGITQYILRKPTVMKGEASINIANNIRLIIVSQSAPDDKIFYDILKAINVKKEDCLILSPAQLFMPLNQLNHVIWFINENIPDSWKSAHTLNDKAIIETTTLSELAQSPNLKRQLWRTLCQYENYFNAH
ncbi:DNA polymerase III subunit psi [Orbus wheelerorum]|uniref:DNA polymerase III subunit psi n=1 Tax=Orbus wheelerorum TaxID=3074111 RepID=UPI00370D32F5